MPTLGDQPDSLDDAWARRVSAGVAAGSREALAALYERRFDRLFRLVRARAKRDDAFAIDCVHDAWLRVVHSLPALPGAAALDAWLTRAALSAMIDCLKSEASRARRDALSARPTAINDDDLVESLRIEMSRLSAADRSVIDLRFRRGLSLAALAGALGIDMKAAEMRLRRALQRLRGRLDEVPHE